VPTLAGLLRQPPVVIIETVTRSQAHRKHDSGTHFAARPRSQPPGYAWAMARDRRGEHPVEPVFWISPQWPQPHTSSAAFAHRVAGDAVITLLGPAVWDIAPGGPYGLATEVDAVNAVARARALSRYHLFGFSAGATVALAATLALGDAVQSLTLLESSLYRGRRLAPQRDRVAGQPRRRPRPASRATQPGVPADADAAGRTASAAGTAAAVGRQNRHA
jgi:pimeloyl-ACP methyl ester carboxylesterase